MTARRGTAPCGHPGRFVTANFISCDIRCEFAADNESDAIPVHVDPERTTPICPHFDCPGGEIEIWPPEWRHADGRDFWICHECGRSFYA